MSVGFGRLVIKGQVFDDPYVLHLEELDGFEVISDTGPRYRVIRESGDRRVRHWGVTRVEPGPEELAGSIVCRIAGTPPFSYLAKRPGAWFAEGEQTYLINAVFSLID